MKICQTMDKIAIWFRSKKNLLLVHGNRIKINFNRRANYPNHFILFLNKFHLYKTWSRCQIWMMNSKITKILKSKLLSQMTLTKTKKWISAILMHLDIIITPKLISIKCNSMVKIKAIEWIPLKTCNMEKWFLLKHPQFS